ncbi:MAG: sialate O-acetylesterase [Acidobacteria bacterium]|nr:sialate O-acetylesterase [Acidobacteriota bacterium]MDA1234929.1 sialate O-acetylesterase [Acidobacteriota bacterium]
MTRRLLSPFLLTLLLAAAASAELRLPAIFSDHMILQRGAPDAVWGWADSGSRVTVRFAGQFHSTTAAPDGKWMVRLDPLEASAEPREFSVEAQAGDTTETIRLQDVVVGEVWLLSGQSNMEMPLKGYGNQPINGSNDAIAHANNRNLRLFTVPHVAVAEPASDVVGRWEPSSPAVALDFSAVGHTFITYIQGVLDVPVGAIDSSWGGTPVQAWTERSILGAVEGVDLTRQRNRDQDKPEYLYNGMIHPLVPYGIRGALWYQGESNVGEAHLYQGMFSAMIANWRDRFERGDFPFYFVQIAPYEYGQNNSAYLREAQLKTMLNVPNTGMASTMDIGLERNIHPPEKIVVGKRLAYWALAKAYGMQGVRYSGPVYREMSVEEGAAVLQFDHAPDGLSAFGAELTGFAIAGDDKVFHAAKAEIVRGGNLRVSSDAVPNPVAVRYAWQNWIVGSLFNNAGLPASSFRTDKW